MGGFWIGVPEVSLCSTFGYNLASLPACAGSAGIERNYMFQAIVKWLVRGLGVVGLGPAERVVPTKLPATERIGDALDRGAQLRPLKASDLSAEFEAKLVAVCKADSNVASLWLTWLSSAGAAPEMLATLLLDRPDEVAIRNFIKHADALGGPSFVVAIPDGVPVAKPFYRRE